MRQTKEEVEHAGRQNFETDPKDHSGKPPETVKHDGSDSKEDKLDHAHDSDKKGTGMKYVKSSGLAADGGDFDASKPGAGREAQREC